MPKRCSRSRTPIIDRPFEDAIWFNAIGWPFKHGQASRFSDGSFGIWYGCGTIEATVFETTHHWVNGLVADAGFERERVIGDRKLFKVACDATATQAWRGWRFQSNIPNLGLLDVKNVDFAEF